MSLPRPPGLEPRRQSDFERELLTRARAWIPSWGLAEGERDFGQALVEIAARISSEVAERLDRVGDKVARGFLDWLAVRGDAAKPARMPVVFKLAETAQASVLAPRPVKMQVDALDATVTFETETNIRVVPGTLDAVVGADPGADAFFLPPPGLSSLEPLEPLPTQWRLKNFASPESAMLQFDPGLGLEEGMLVEIAGAQYRLLNPKGDLGTIDPSVPAGDGFAAGTLIKKVEAFYPFDGARDRQNHILYIGHNDLLNIEAEATIDVVGASALQSGVTWEYFGKDAKALPPDADPRWRPLAIADQPHQKADALVLTKPNGSIEPTTIGTTERRWIRARKAHLDGSSPTLTSEGISLRINAPPPGGVAAAATPHPPVEAIVNTTPSPTQGFYPLGREPRLFDTLYLGCAEAFSKVGATAMVQFFLAESVFASMSVIDAGFIGYVVAGVDSSGALHLFRLNTDGTLIRLPNREPSVPAEGARLVPEIEPVLWMVNGILHVAVATKDKVYLWQEWPPFFSSFSHWEELGSPLPAVSTEPVSGLVLIRHPDTGLRLAALRDKILSERAAASGTAPFAPINAPGMPADIAAIASVQDENPATSANVLVAVTGPLPADPHALYTVTLNAAVAPLPVVATKMLDDIALNVRPFAMLRNSGDVEVAAVDDARDTLLAKHGAAGALVQTDLDPNFKLVIGATIGGRLDSGNLAVYAIAESDLPPHAQSLVAWLPFAPAQISQILFSNIVDSSIGLLNGGLTIFDSLGALAPMAILPGNNKGEIFAAKLGGTRTPDNEDGSKFLSALAVANPPTGIAAGDTIAPLDANGDPIPASIIDGGVDGRGSSSNLHFFWLDKAIDRPADKISIPLFQTSVPGGFNGSVAADMLTLGDPAVTHDWVLLQDTANPSTRIAAKILTIAAGIAQLDRNAPAAITNVKYWRSSVDIQGTIFPALQHATSAWTTDRLDRANIYFPSLHPIRQRVIAYLDDTLKHPERLAFASPWNNPPPAAGQVDFIIDGETPEWSALFGETSSNPALSWEYWNGTGWWRLKLDKDETSNLKNSGTVQFAVPNDLKPVDWAGKTNHWIRARLIGGDYGKEKVVVKTKPGTPPNTSEQTVERTTEGIQPPYALDIQVSYQIDQPVAPEFLLTEDSGTLRDQSDANRTPAAEIDIFTPLIYTLSRFSAPAGAAGQADASDCVPDCDCPSGTASTSPGKKKTTPTTPPSTPKSSDDCNCASGGADTQAQGTAESRANAASPSRAGRRALYLGLNSKLSGEPINVLLVVEKERSHDAFAPLTVEALTGDRFVPVLASDDTRALGETGLVSMSFSVEPTSAELFGRTLSWLRLTPSGADAEWKPTLRGAYLNAVWARAAETMTRELVGSSEGAPNLTLQLARPPLLDKSLELRVREPLGMEERKQLVESDPNKVKSAVTDLPGDWVLWKQADDPVDCGPTDRVYALAEDTGTIRFGDGRHGAIPPIGVDCIVAFQYERTEAATPEGVPANFVAPRAALNLVTPVESVEAVIAADQSAGGVAPESVERVLKFGAAKLRHRGRAVTARDFEDLALEASADVVQARCFVRGGKIQLIVVIRGKGPQPSRAQQRELRRLLLAASQASLAAPGVLRIEGPTVRRLRIHLTLRVARLDLAGTLAAYVKKTLNSYFDTETGGDREDGWPLGANPGENDVAEALLDAPDLESIASISFSEVAADGSEQPWPESIRSGELAMLADDGIRIAFEIVEAGA